MATKKASHRKASKKPPTRRKKAERKPPSAPEETPPKKEHGACPIVGIGASAGGFEATMKFLQAMPPDSDIGFVLIQHLDPERESLTAELLAKRSKLHVSEAADQTRVEPNHLYVIPPDRYLAVKDGVLHVTRPDVPRGARAAIDFFLRSLAEDCREKAIAIILSGTGADGVLGARAVKAHGGMTIAQEPSTAQHEGMPSAAIAAGVIDHVLPVETMPGLLISYTRHPYANGKAIEVENPATSSAQQLNTILNWLRTRTKYDFRTYKKATLARRTARRMSLHRIESLPEYLEFLRQRPDEANSLIKDLLINVTEFFREPDAWRELENSVLKPLLASKGPEAPIRVWTPGCATGEEPYTIAMLLFEHVQKLQKHNTVQVFATDIDREAVEFARQGRYPASIATDVPPERLARFFVERKGEHTYEISKALREMVMFAEQNLISDPPFSRLDLICCRNVLIYLEPDVQEKILALFHFALLEGGVLFLGNAESIGRQHDLFQPISHKWRIFRRIGPVRQERVNFPILPSGRRRAEPLAPPPPRRDTRLAQLAQQQLLDRLAPASILIDEHFEILYFCGPTEDFLTQPPGPPTMNLLSRAREGLCNQIRGAVRQALSERRTVELETRVRYDNGVKPVQLTVAPVEDSQERSLLALVIFEAKRRPKSQPAQAAPPTARDQDDESVIGHLERELLSTKEDLQATIEQYETSTEELKAANEEVMSINEELQSSNEELETSKEELQSLNEELTTVNAQVAAKIVEVEAKNDDLTNLLASTDLATLCLDSELGIKWFTPAMQSLVSIVRSDVGRPMRDLTHKFTRDDLMETAASVLKSLAPHECEVETEDGRCFLRRVLPYRTADNRIDGVVSTFTDITRRKSAEERLRRVNESLEQTVDERTQLLRLVRDVAAAANEAGSVENALRFTLQSICKAEHWEAGLVYQRDADGQFVPSVAWPANPRYDPQPSPKSAKNSTPLAKQQIEQVLRTGSPCWVDDLNKPNSEKRGREKESNLTSTIWIPVFASRHAVAVLEFHSATPISPDERFLEAMHNIGSQLGQVMERKELEKQVAEATDREQRRIGQELHDGLGQQISGLAMMAATVAGQLDREQSPHAAAMHKLLKAAEQAKVQARALSKGLMPVEVEGQGLMAALQELAESVQKMHPVECVFDCSKPVVIKDSFTASHLYHIAREAIFNAVKHGTPQRVRITLAGDPSLTLTVTDDGNGFKRPPEELEGQGLRIMRYRAGLIGATLMVHSAPEGGVLVICTPSQKLLS
jgi:two-component system CheB/CheR fusion protein